ncbi:response regulator [Corallococcus sp. bb12-1]|uniref:response regulator n=1 Tax=Corallococcus sp. bb12-1 TaxID=2996784 RepID=UPI0022706044|nr:response regulator [Corallococcus sp. bb12-1]MCY1043324.1 response regulator [Corallococcus sp. bb12-1]
MAASQPPLLLVVEQLDDLREALGDLLGTEGYAIATAATPQRALELLAGEVPSPSLILLSVGMDQRDAEEFLGRLTLMTRVRSSPVVIITAATSITEPLPGSVALLRKLTGVEELLATVARHRRYDEPPG